MPFDARLGVLLSRLRGRLSSTSCPRQRLVPLLGLALAGCNTGDSHYAERSRVAAVRYDSAGVEIVVNGPLVSPAPQPWRVASDPIVVIGASSDMGDTPLFQVRGALRTEDGRIVVANGSSGQILHFDRSGKLIRASGGIGSGPGEYRFMAVMRPYRSDSLFVWDQRLQRGTVLDLHGNIGRTFHPAHLVGGFEVPTLYESAADGSFLGVSHMTERLRAEASIKGELGQVLIRYSPHGQPLQTYGGLRAPPCEDPTNCRRGVMFGYERRFATDSRFVYYAFNDRYEIEAYDEAAQLRRIIRLQQPSMTISEEALLAYVRTNFTQERRARALAILRNEAQGTPVMPAFKSFITDRHGNLWIEEVTEVRADMLMFFYSPLSTPWLPTDQRPLWSVIDTSGALLNTVQMPRGLIPMDIGDDYVLGVHVDELGVESVRMYPLTR